MFKDGFDNLERYTRELKAVKNYARVKEDRDSLAKEAAQLREKAVQLETQLQSEVSTRKQLSLQLSKRETEVKELSGKLTQAQTELSALSDFKVKLPQGSGLTLEEMKDHFLQIQEEEIERRVKEHLEELGREMRSQMPTRVRKELIQVLKRPSWPAEIAKVVNSRARQIAEESLQDKGKWPDWFTDYYLRQVREAVGKGLDSEFEKRVEVEAQKRLETMKAGQWEKYIAAKVRELAIDLKAVVSQLQGTWWFSCDSCGRRLALDIGASEIGELLGGRTVDMACPICLDPAPFPFILSNVPHKVGSLTLEGLLRLYMGKASSAE